MRIARAELVALQVIMADGRLRTVGTAAELKSRFGKGYKLTVTCADHGDKDQAIAYVPFITITRGSAPLQLFCLGSSRS